MTIIHLKKMPGTDILLCIQTGKVQDEDRMRYEGGQYYLNLGRDANCSHMQEKRSRIQARLPNVVMLKSYLENRKCRIRCEDTAVVSEPFMKV